MNVDSNRFFMSFAELSRFHRTKYECNGQQKAACETKEKHTSLLPPLWVQKVQNEHIYLRAFALPYGNGNAGHIFQANRRPNGSDSHLDVTLFVFRVSAHAKGMRVNCWPRSVLMRGCKWENYAIFLCVACATLPRPPLSLPLMYSVHFFPFVPPRYHSMYNYTKCAVFIGTQLVLFGLRSTPKGPERKKEGRNEAKNVKRILYFRYCFVSSLHSTARSSSIACVTRFVFATAHAFMPHESRSQIGDGGNDAVLSFSHVSKSRRALLCVQCLRLRLEYFIKCSIVWWITFDLTLLFFSAFRPEIIIMEIGEQKCLSMLCLPACLPMTMNWCVDESRNGNTQHATKQKIEIRRKRSERYWYMAHNHQKSIFLESKNLVFIFASAIPQYSVMITRQTRRWSTSIPLKSEHRHLSYLARAFHGSKQEEDEEGKKAIASIHSVCLPPNKLEANKSLRDAWKKVRIKAEHIHFARGGLKTHRRIDVVVAGWLAQSANFPREINHECVCSLLWQIDWYDWQTTKQWTAALTWEAVNRHRNVSRETRLCLHSAPTQTIAIIDCSGYCFNGISSLLFARNSASIH